MVLQDRRQFLALSLAMLGAAPAHAQVQRPLRIVTTTGMIADAARQVGGELVDVKGLMGPGVDPHAYRQTRSDIAAMANADLVLWHGLYLEAQLEKFLLDLGKRRRVIAVAEAIPASKRLAHDDYKDRFDPHVWMNPDLWETVVLAVRDAMTALRPQQKPALEARAAAHVKEIASLSAYSTTTLASVPKDQRVLISAHDAFKYFGAAYDFEVMGIQGISTESEAGLNRIRDLVEFIVSRRIKAIFVESSVSDRNIRAVIEGAAVRGWQVALGGELFSDAMGPEGSYEGTYLGMIDHNVTTIARALGGEAPARGLGGKLALKS
jgi:manganese/zinc/iron transport system substrate-binding protein